MRFAISVIKSEKTTKQGKTSSYIQNEVTYKRLDTGKIESKKFMSFVKQSEAIYKALSDCQMDDQFLVTSEKNEGTGYWDWTEIVAQVPGQAAPVPATGSSVAARSTTSTPVRSSYETPEERAKKQVYIVKQSCLNQAVAVLSVGAKTPPEDGAILQKAQKYVDWVFEDNKAEVPSLMDMPNDFPDVD